MVVNKNEPEFDFSTFSWRDSKNVVALQARGNRVDALLRDRTVLLNGEAFAEALQEQESVFMETQGYICKVLVSVPRDWLIEDAPGAIDWKDPASLDWLKGPKFRELQGAMQRASQPESVAGN